MGNKFICMTKKDTKNGGIGSRSKRGSMSRRRTLMEEELLHRQALAMAIQQHQLSQRFDNGSMSRRIGSTSSRRRTTNLSDPFSNTNNKQLPEFLENIKTKKFVLVHGEGFGAWCWYKSIALLEEAGSQPVALDLMGSGIDITDTNSVTTLAEYSKPLIDFLEKLPEDDKARMLVTLAPMFTSTIQFLVALSRQLFWTKCLTVASLQVILVGHSSGGACVSYTLEHLPHKISKAVYLCATMISDGQRPFDVFAEEGASKVELPPEFLFSKKQLRRRALS
ncbi:UNVERIFIED_CONTAM: putative methylesterase 12, chloroplastic [Sesamum radiatum]|uniref:Methylesterase 12, chloroplastic n=1 Tax=Sesamum radiatum TaxID=300843 RepID=A0AAW2PX86_SESRA